MLIIDNTRSKVSSGTFVRSTIKGTIAVINSVVCSGVYNITIIKPGFGSSAFVGQYLSGVHLNGWQVIDDVVLTINGKY